jgi:deoxyhypusine monooxygenase
MFSPAIPSLPQIQNKDPAAIPILVDVLKDKQQQVMVRHEAAEALSVLGGEQAFAVLREYVTDERKEVSETCQIALDRIEFANKHGKEACTK